MRGEEWIYLAMERGQIGSAVGGKGGGTRGGRRERVYVYRLGREGGGSRRREARLGKASGGGWAPVVSRLDCVFNFPRDGSLIRVSPMRTVCVRRAEKCVWYHLQWGDAK
jgi:hypothetical protein